MSDGADTPPCRLTVLNPGGRDPEQHFPNGAGAPGAGHPPTNFHGYAACTRGSFHREIRRAIAEETPVLLLLRGDFRHSQRALRELQSAGRKVAVSLKETGLHQIANQLAEPTKLARFVAVIREADLCIAATAEAAELYQSIRRDKGKAVFIPTPYPIEDVAWDFSLPPAERSGIFIGTREFNVPSRNHIAALLLSRELSDAADEPVTVYNFDGRRGSRLLDEIGFAQGRLRIETRRLAYPDYVRQISRHKLVLQLDTSFVPGQVAGDSLLARVPCVGGNGATERIAFPDLCSASRTISDVGEIALHLLTDKAEYERQLSEMTNNGRPLSFGNVATELAQLLSGT